MVARKITSYSKKGSKRLLDSIGALEKAIKMRRMEPYADIINAEMEKYNKDDSSRTMMFKLLRNPVQGTTTRGKHTRNVAQIAGEIADEFDWLSSDLTRVMGRHHDIGHTFLGHSGEWWLSSVKDTYAMGNYVHNATGARKLIYREDIVGDVEKAIKEKYPNINPLKLSAIKRDLWLVIDGILSHNGEKSEYSYAPDFSKDKKRFYDELMGCFIKKGYDKTLVPATAEGSLMRLSDKISYIPFDLVDCFRNGCNIEHAKLDGKERNFYQEYSQKFEALGMGKDSLERLLNCKTEADYDNFAYDMQRILIEDVKKNSKRNNIRMSPEKSKIMHGIRDINNSMMVNYTVMKEDHEVYPEAMKTLMKKFSKLLLGTGLIDKNNVKDSRLANLSERPDLQEELRKTYGYMPEISKFIDYISKTNSRDFEFTVDMIKKAFDETIDNELEAAKYIASGSLDGVTVEAKGLKNERMNTYIEAFSDSLEKAYQESILDEGDKGKVNEFKKNIWLNKTKQKIQRDIYVGFSNEKNLTGILPEADRVALEIGAQFLSSLNDNEWKQILLDSQIVDEQKMSSLTRQYPTFDFREESQKHKDWDNIAKLQAKSTENTVLEERKENFITKAKRFLGIEKEREI